MSDKRMFEFVEGSSSKFWEVWRSGSEVRTRYGKIGTAGQVTVKDEGTEEKGIKLYNKLIAEKTKKGYEEKTAGGAPSATTTMTMPPAQAKATAATPDFSGLLKKVEEKAKKAGVTLPAGASEAAFTALETTLGFPLSASMKAYYRAHDGGPEDADDFVDADDLGGRELLSLERIASEWKVWKGLLDAGDFGDNDHSDPEKGVQQRWWIPQWVPVTYDGSGNHHVVDMAPADFGVAGQVLSFWHDEETRTVVGKGFLAWLASPDTKFNGGEGGDEDEGEGGGWRRFEVDEKFWMIKLDGASHTVRYGKIGTDGAEKTKDFDDDDAAQKDHDKLVKEKTKKGYEEADG